jgi:hypothetical protein
VQAARVVARTAGRHLLRPDDVRLPDRRGEFLDLAASRFGGDAGLTRVCSSSSTALKSIMEEPFVKG